MKGRARKSKPDFNSWSLEILAENDPAQAVDEACVGIGADLSTEQVLRLVLEFGFRHVCQKRGFEYEREVRSAQELIASPESFLNFPLCSVMRPDSCNLKTENQLIVFQSEFNASERKRDTLAQLTKALEPKIKSQTILEDCVSIADEYYTNAIFNAPFVDAKTHLNPGINRQDWSVEYSAGKKSRLFAGLEESRLVIGCMDPFGSLGVERFLSSVRRSFLNGPASTMNFAPGGAGIGSYIIVNTSSSVYVGVWPGHATMFCCVIPLGLNYRKRIELPKQIHWVQPLKFFKKGEE